MPKVSLSQNTPCSAPSHIPYNAACNTPFDTLSHTLYNKFSHPNPHHHLHSYDNQSGLHAEIFVLKDRITKLSGNILDLEARLLLCEKQKRAAERALDKSTVERAEAAASGVSSSGGASATTTHPIIASDGSQVWSLSSHLLHYLHIHCIIFTYLLQELGISTHLPNI